MLRFLAAISSGVTAGAVIGALVTGDPRYSVLWSVLLGVSILLGFGSLFTGRGSRGRGGATGELCLARVERIARADAAGGQPLAELTVAPARRPAYTVTHPAPSDAELRPGQVVVVQVLTPKAPNVVLVPDPPAAWERRRAAEQLRTGSERTVPLMAAPWAAAAPSPAPAPSGGRTAGAVLASVLTVVLFAGAAGATLVPAVPTIARGVAAIASGDPGAAGVVEGTRHAEIVAALVDEVGADEFVSIAFYDGYALATAPAEPRSLLIDDYQYRYDRTEHQGPTLIQPQTPAADLFAASEADFTDVRGLIAAAKEHSGIPEPDSVIVIFSRTSIADESGERPVEARVLLDSPYEDASVAFDAKTGELRP